MYPDASETDPNCLPEAEQAAPFFGGGLQQDGVFSYPHINSIVWCFFENCDQNRPVYFASTLGGEMANSTDSGYKIARSNVKHDDNPADDTTRNNEDAQIHVLRTGHSTVVVRESGQIVVTCEAKPPTDAEKESAGEDESEGQGKANFVRIEIDEGQGISIKTNGGIALESDRSIALKSDTIQFTANQMVMTSTASIDITAPSLTTTNTNSFIAKSSRFDVTSDTQAKIRGKNETKIF